MSGSDVTVAKTAFTAISHAVIPTINIIFTALTSSHAHCHEIFYFTFLATHTGRYICVISSIVENNHKKCFFH